MTECEAMQALLEYAQKEQYDFIVKNSARDEEYQLIMKRADSTPKIFDLCGENSPIRPACDGQSVVLCAS